MKIRKATIKDLYTIKNLNQELFHDNKKYDKTLDIMWPRKNLKYYRNCILGRNSVAFVAEEDNKVVGYIIGSIAEVEDYRIVKKMGEVENLIVLPYYRGRGIAKKLMREFIIWAKKRKVKRIKVSIYADNELSVNFHRKMGFVDYDKTMELEI